jgi:hypothetical protein
MAVIFIWMAVLLNSSYAQQNQNDAAATQAKKDIDTCIARLYKILSYQNSKLDNVDGLPELFVPDGTLTAAFATKPMLWTASQFVSFIKNGAAQGATSRIETEVHEKTEVFGNIAHRFSTYSLKMKVGVKAEERRGINSIQLIKQNGRWLIHSLIWDREREGLKLPQAYGGQ